MRLPRHRKQPFELDRPSPRAVAGLALDAMKLRKPIIPVRPVCMQGQGNGMRVVVPKPRRSAPVDRFGALSSGLRAAHYALCTLLPAAFGALGLGFLLGHEAEWGFTLIAVTFAAGALALGWRRQRSLVVAALLVLGIVGLLASRSLEMDSANQGASHLTGTAVGVVAGLLLLAGHMLNPRKAPCCQGECE